MKDALVRAVRTFAQAFIGTVLTTGILSGFATDGIVDLSALAKVGVSALAGGVVAVLTFAQNALEDVTGKTALK